MKYLFITRTDWSEPPRARHQLARELAKNNEVVFVSIHKSGKPKIEKKIIEKNITLIIPYWFWHGKYIFRIPIINEIYQFWLYRKLKKEFYSYRVINFDPSATLLHNFFNNIVYFCNDDFINIKRSKFLITKLYFKLSQRIISQNARFCASVSYYLKNQLAKHTRFSHLVLTAAEEIDLNLCYKNPSNSKINAIYIGWLSKLNKDWILALSKNKKVNIKLIGPYVASDFKELMKKENIHFLGQKVNDELFKYLKEADVCLAPYIIGRDTNEVYTMPNKFWLYINFGLPIVSCQINRLFNLPKNFVYQVKNEMEFVNSVLKSYSDNSNDLFLERRRFIKDNNWQSRVHQLQALYK